MQGDVLQPDMLDKLRSLEWFRDYEAAVVANAEASAKVTAEAWADVRAAEANARLARERAQFAEAKAEILAGGRADTLAATLTDFFAIRGG